MPQPVYLDHAATTPVRREVFEAMEPFFGPRFGNPSSVHRWGREARAALDEARERVARCLGAQPDEVCFTSGGTEADNLAVLGPLRSQQAKGRTTIVSTPIEHKAVLATVHHAARLGVTERMLGVTSLGVVDMDAIDAAIDDKVAVCTVMWVNNEIGTIQPVPEIAERVKANGGIMHTDAVQAFAKVDFSVKNVPVDLLTISGHKIGAPKGVGAVYIRRGTKIDPMFHGGSQDRGRRPGTENVAAAVALARAAELALEEHEAECARLTSLRDALEEGLLARIPDAVVHGRGAPRASHIMNISVPGTDSESLLMALDLAGVAASSGSACQSGNVTPSHVLAAMGVKPDLAVAAIRMSLGSLTTPDCITRVVELFPALIAKARRLSGMAS
ncbi:MAG TPA: cysteine desulfurase family protein [Gemmatimonadaceae bacterium]|nr:cysteine desulfurase family protein [Gemmatimonadaceae bacterium]